MEGDLPRLVEMGLGFFASTGYARIVEFDGESTSRTLGALIREEQEATGDADPEPVA